MLLIVNEIPANPLIDPNPRSPYFIVAPDYTRFSGGVRVLHLLAHLLIQQGYQAFLTPARQNPKWCVPTLTLETVHTYNEAGVTPIVVYPETISGNPFNSRCVVRYMLNYPGKLGGETEFPDSELLLWFSKQMRDHAGSAHPVMCLPYFDTSFYFPPPPGSLRQGTCFYAGKYKEVHGGRLLPVTEGGVEIIGRGHPGAQTQAEVAELFRKSELFYSYENTGLISEAILCGCPAVLIPNDHFSAAELILPDEMGATGIAWGTDPAEIARARQTIQEAGEKFELWIASFRRQLEDFISVTQSRSKDSSRRFPLKYADPYGFSDYGGAIRSLVEANGILLKENQEYARQNGEILRANSELLGVVSSAEAWQRRSWVKRAFHRWRPQRKQ